MLLAAQAMAAGTLMVPWVTRYVDPVMATGWHMVLGGVPLVATSLATERDELACNLSQINGWCALCGRADVLLLCVSCVCVSAGEVTCARLLLPERLLRHPHDVSSALAGDVVALTYTSLLGGAAAYGVFLLQCVERQSHQAVQLDLSDAHVLPHWPAFCF